MSRHRVGTRTATAPRGRLVWLAAAALATAVGTTVTLGVAAHAQDGAPGGPTVAGEPSVAPEGPLLAVEEPSETEEAPEAETPAEGDETGEAAEEEGGGAGTLMIVAIIAAAALVLGAFRMISSSES